MIKSWLLAFEALTGLDTPQLQAISAIFAIVGFFLFHTGRIFGWRAAHYEMRQFKKRVDDDHVVIERLIFETLRDGSTMFDRETEGGIHHLKDVFGSDKLIELIRAAIRKGVEKDGRIFPPGPTHRLMMERVDAYVSGNDRVASQAAMFGRSAEYQVDEVAFTVEYMVGEDGFAMLHVLLINPRHLRLLKEKPGFRTWLIPVRQSYGARYFNILPLLASEYAASEKLFRETENEERAGEYARFWTSRIRTQRPLSSR